MGGRAQTTNKNFNKNIFIHPFSRNNMTSDNKIHMPGAFGGLMRYDEEYTSRFMITPMQVVGFIIAIILFVLALKLFFPITPIA